MNIQEWELKQETLIALEDFDENYMKFRVGEKVYFGSDFLWDFCYKLVKKLNSKSSNHYKISLDNNVKHKFLENVKHKLIKC